MKKYCLFYTCSRWDSCGHDTYIVVNENLTLKEAKEKYPEYSFCEDWKTDE